METVIAIGFILMGFAVPVMFCWGFYFGFCYSEDIFRDKMLHKEKIPGYPGFAAMATGKTKETDRERKSRIMSENVENFGTDIPQREVE